MREDHFSEVLWDDEVVDAPPVAPRRPLPRPPRWLVLALAGVVASGGVVALAVDRAHEHALDLRLAATPGLVPDLGDPLVTGWSTDGWGVLGAAGDVLVVQRSGGVSGIDAATGREVYRRDGGCSTTQGTTWWDWSGTEVPGTGLLVCQRDEFGSAEVAPVVELTVVDAATGRERSRLEAPAREGWWTLGDQLFALGRDATGHLTAQTNDLPTGRTTWSWRSPVPYAPGTGIATWPVGRTTVVLEVAGRSTAVDVSTGREVDVDPDDEHDIGEPLVLRDGGTAQAVLGARGLLSAVVVEDADGGDRFRTDGALLVPEADDGSAPGLLLVAHHDPGRSDGRDLAALDAATGDVRWTADPEGGQVAIVQGVVLIATSRGVVGLDATDGTERWSVEDAEAGRAWGFVTDGRRVLRVDDEPRGERRLVARDVRSGHEVWSSPVDAAAGSALQRRADGSVVLSGDRTVTLLVPPGGAREGGEDGPASVLEDVAGGVPGA